MKQKEKNLSEHFYENNRQMIHIKVVNCDIHYDKLNETAPKALLGYNYFVDRYHHHSTRLKGMGKNKCKLMTMDLAREDCRKKGLLLDYIDLNRHLISTSKCWD